ncbi:MAG: N-acetyltransferase [Bacteroidetes bacterium]|nr:MAG: N-acetyltransferase [Bacteroidota bacterium]
MAKSETIINTERLQLREIVDSDLENIFNGLSNEDVTKYYAVSFSSLEETKTQMEWYKNLRHEKTGIWWAICSKDHQIFYGAIGYNDLDQEHQKAEIGFWLLPQFWRQGFIKEALSPVIDYGFTILNLHRIEAFVESGNEASSRMLKSKSFNYEGTLRECELKSNHFISLDVFAKINQSTS